MPDFLSTKTIPGPAGNIEILTALPADENAGPVNPASIAVICHPHPLFEGTMHNKVVTTLSKAFLNKGCATVRFNFRGVGKSDGVHDEARGEQQDCLAVVDWAKQQFPDATLYLAGFSFGSYVAAAASVDVKPAKLVLIAPPVNHYNFAALTPFAFPWVVMQGSDDEIVPANEVDAFVKSQTENPAAYHVFPGVSHFFHGQLVALRETVESLI